MGFVGSLPAFVISFGFLAVMLYKRVNIGVTLNLTALLLAFLSLDLQQILPIIIDASIDLRTISVVLATFGIMILSQYYKETGLIRNLSESLRRIINNSKLIVSTLPAIIGLLPVAGGALMSAPLVEAETEKLGLKAEEKTYVNVWFRHTIFPVYPISQVLILTAGLTGLAVTSIIIRQIPVVISMILIGYIIGLWRTTSATDEEENSGKSRISELRRFLIAFSPILATIISVFCFDAIAKLSTGTIGYEPIARILDVARVAEENGFDVSVAAFVGVVGLLLITRPKFKICTKPFMNLATYGIVLATYGAFLLRKVVEATDISEIFGNLVANGNINNTLLLVIIPTVLAFFVGSPLGAVAISFSMLEGTLNFTSKSAALLYIGSYLGYVIAPTHLCLVLTAEYFRCSLSKLYKYLVPSLTVSFAAAIIFYILF